MATFALTILGTFLTRSGVLSSVHAFGDGPIGTYLLVFFGLVVTVSLALIGWRGDRLRSPGAIDSPLSREGAFLANNVLFTVFAFVVLLGTVFPLLVEALQDRQTVVGAPYFDRLSTPIGLALLFLMAIAPGAAVAQGQPGAAAGPAVLAGVVRRHRARRRRRRSGRRAGHRWLPSRSPVPPPARRCASWSWRPGGRDGGGSSAAPTAGWSSTSA